MQRKFNKRAFVSLVSLFLGFSVLLTGFLLYILPHADGVSVLGLSGRGWSFFHMVVSIYFTAIIIFHIIENWKPMMSYMKSKSSENFKYKRELLSALVVSVLLTVGSFTDSPVSAILDIFDPISEYFWPEFIDNHH